MRDWRESTLGDVICEMRNGVNCKQDKNGVGDKITRIETISDATLNLERVGYSILSHKEKEKYKLVSGDILFSHINSVVHVGKTALLEQNCDIYHGVNLMLFRSHNFMVPKFLQFYLRMIFQAGYWRTLCKQSVNQASVNQTDIKKVPIKYPSISEQKRIVAILDEAFVGIDQAIANTEKNLANARELFESHLNTIFTQKGEGWVETTIGDQITLQRGFDITKKEQRPGDVPVVSSGGIKSFHDETKAFGPGVVVGRKGSIGSVYFVDCDYWPHDTTLWVKDFKINNEHLVYYLLKSLDLVHLDTGTANPALNRNLVHPLKISWPPIDRQEMIVDKIEAIEKHTAKLEAIYQQKLTALNELKQSLLQKAFSGELTTDELPIKKEVAA